MKDGGILLSSHCDDPDWVSKAKDILKRAGAEDIASAGEKAVSSHRVRRPQHTEQVHLTELRMSGTSIRQTRIIPTRRKSGKRGRNQSSA